MCLLLVHMQYGCQYITNKAELQAPCKDYSYRAKHFAGSAGVTVVGAQG